MASVLRFRKLDRAELNVFGDGLAAALVASLPWSTTATSILAVAWLIVAVQTLDLADVRRECLTAAGGLPLLLWTLALIGMLWANVSLAERLHGFTSFQRFLFIPLLLARFRVSPRGHWIIAAFFASCVMLLVASWFLVVFPEFQRRGGAYGVPAKDYISQSGIFTLCIFGLLGKAVAFWRERRVAWWIGSLVLSLIFLINILYIATSRTTLVVIPVLLLLFAVRQLGWKAVLLLLGGGALLAAMVWQTSPYLRQRVLAVPTEIADYRLSDAQTSSGERLDYWRKSLNFVKEAPVIGHGTGSINQLFRNAAVGTSGVASEATTNPHNQTFAIAIQLGFAGVVLLYAMWLSHLFLFGGAGFAAWLGLVIIVQNIVSSIFNSHLFDFTQGWTYVLSVGILGGVVRGYGQPPNPGAAVDTMHRS